MTYDDAKSILTQLFDFSLKSVLPKTLIPSTIQLRDETLHFPNFSIPEIQAIYIIGFGKASSHMAKELEILLGNRITGGCVVTKYNHTAILKSMEQIEAGHPIPDKNSYIAADKILSVAHKATHNDLVIACVSGGGSALMALGAGSISLSDKRIMTSLLLKCGASIGEINTIRKHISLVKGGRLREAIYPASLVSLILSDVIDNDISFVASGPTLQNESTCQQALDIIHHYRLYSRIPLSIRQHLENNRHQSLRDSPLPKDSNTILLANNGSIIDSATEEGKKLGYSVISLKYPVKGEAKQAAKEIAHEIKEWIKRSGRPSSQPCLFITGGETTVIIDSEGGLGGRNQECALAFAIEMKDQQDWFALFTGTDGSDGPTLANGAFCHSNTYNHALTLDLNPHDSLKNHDSHPFFQKLSSLFITGPTQTNVNDLVLIIYNPH
ncbi:MAG: hydroxypyruvate reductase [bacterium]|nr:MAG: hydroxypyruvate reductase [bacterium]